MFTRKPKYDYLEDINDPLARRIALRTLREQERNSAKEAFWRGAMSGAGANGPLGLLVAFPFYMAWLVMSAAFDEVADRLRQRSKKRARTKNKRSKIKVHYREV